MSNRVLIIGGTGFIGHHLVNFLIKKKFKVTSFSLKQPLRPRKVKKCKYIYGDISQKKELTKKLKFRKFDYVINLGGHINHREKIKTYNSHFKGCKNLADFFLNQNIKSFIQIGSSVEYGNSSSPQNEKIKCNKPKSCYAKSKLKATHYLLKLNNKLNFPAVILRPYIVYGPGQTVDRLIPFVISNSLNNKLFDCTNGRQIRDFIYIEDFIFFIFLIIKNYKTSNGEIFNVGSGKKIKIKTLINKIVRYSGSGKPNFGSIKMREDEPLNLYPSISKIKKRFNWYPRFNIDKGLKLTINFYKK